MVLLSIVFLIVSKTTGGKKSVDLDSTGFQWTSQLEWGTLPDSVFVCFSSFYLKKLFASVSVLSVKRTNQPLVMSHKALIARGLFFLHRQLAALLQMKIVWNV